MLAFGSALVKFIPTVLTPVKLCGMVTGVVWVTESFDDLYTTLRVEKILRSDTSLFTDNPRANNNNYYDRVSVVLLGNGSVKVFSKYDIFGLLLVCFWRTNEKPGHYKSKQSWSANIHPLQHCTGQISSSIVTREVSKSLENLLGSFRVSAQV